MYRVGITSRSDQNRARMFLLGGGGSSPVDGSQQFDRTSIPLAQYGPSPQRCSTSSSLMSVVSADTG